VSEGGWAAGSHDVVWIEGPDAISFADGQLSQDVSAMRPGEVRRALLLEPRGKLRGILWVLAGEDVVGLLTWAGTGRAVGADLERFLFRVDVLVSTDEAAGSSRWGPTGAGSTPGEWSGDRHRARVALPAGRAPAELALGPLPTDAPLLGSGTMLLHRVMAGEPVFGRDVDEDTIPHETGLVAESVSFTKGCYLGQELVSRIETRGHVNRSLRRVTIADGLPPAGAAIESAGSPVGLLGSVAASGDGAEAIALVRREAVPGNRVVVRWEAGEAVGEIVEIIRDPQAAG